MFSYAKWLCKFSNKIYPLYSLSKFSLNSQQIKSSESFKIELANAVIQIVDKNILFTVETDFCDTKLKWKTSHIPFLRATK